MCYPRQSPECCHPTRRSLETAASNRLDPDRITSTPITQLSVCQARVDIESGATVFHSSNMPIAAQPLPFPGAENKTDRIAAWLAAALGFSIPISVALDNLLLVLILVLWFVSGRFKEKWPAIRNNPVGILALTGFALYLVGMTYTDAWRDALEMLGKATRFLVIPILFWICRDGRTRRRSLGGFLLAMSLTMAVSYLVWLDVLPQMAGIKGTSADPVVFKWHITHSLFMAFAAYLFAVASRDATGLKTRVFLGALSALAAFNVLVMVHGRTGQLVLVALITYFYFCTWRWRWRGVAMGSVAMAVLAGAISFAPNSALHQRIVVTIDEYANWNPQQASQTSIGLRMEFWSTTLEIIRAHPIIGVGTGGFPQAYAMRVRGTQKTRSENPHNEYFMMMVQFGVVGLAFMLYLFFTQWRRAIALPTAFERDAARGLVIAIGVASLVSSTLIDHAEGLFFVWMSGLLFAGLPTPSAASPNPEHVG